MRRLLCILPGILLLVSVCVTHAQESAVVQRPNTPEQELISLSEQWMAALERKDRAMLERLMADGFYISPPGELQKVERSEWLKNAQEMDWDSLKYHNFKVDIYGDTAVATSRLDFAVTTRSGLPISTSSPVTDIWVMRNGQWQVAARHFGMSSLETNLRVAVGFIAGLALCSVAWLFMRLRRRFAGRRRSA
jgi:ketosteroid isomerase-like protein